MTHTPHPSDRLLRRTSVASSSWKPLLGAALLGLLPLGALAQAVASGSISGRVYNPSPGAYVANAEIRVAGTQLSAVTDSSGNFTLLNVPEGTASVNVNYTGYGTVSASVTVSANQTATQNFDLVAGSAPGKGDDVIQMAAFTVSSEREGNAKAIMSQRNSMNISNSVSSDVFGDVAEGNVGEFLKYLPGVDLEYVEADTRAPKIRGLPPQYTGVTLNGMKLASADAYVQYNSTDNSPAGSSNRSVGFEQISINSIESIEVSLTSSADMDPNSPAGTINMKSKHAFERKGRRISFQANAMANSEDFTFKKSDGPSDHRDYKIKPGGIFEYSDSFLNNRLGVVLTLSESNMFNEQRQVTFGYNTTTTATDQRPYVLNGINFKSGPKFTERFSASLTTDFKVNKELIVTLLSSYNFYHAEYFNRQFAIGNFARANVTGDGLTNFDVINGGATIGNGGGAGGTNTSGADAVKIGRTTTFTPMFEWKKGQVTVDGAVTASRSVSSYGAFGRGITRDVLYNQITKVNAHFERGTPQDPGLSITQTGGPDWGDIGNYINPRIVDDGRFAEEKVYQGQLNAKYSTRWKWPTYFKVGGKITELYHIYDNFTPAYTYSYVGPGGNTLTSPDYGVGGGTTTNGLGTFAGFATPTPFDMGWGTYIKSSSGRDPAFVNRNTMSDLFRSHPEYFVNTTNATNWFDAYVGNHRMIREQFNAGYGMFNTKIKKLQIQAGIRDERTITDSKERNPVDGKLVKAAGYTLDANGRATSVPGLLYQYASQPQVARVGTYSKLFPSAEMKYSFTPNLQFQAGYSSTISRPNFNDIGGVWQINDDAQTVNMPNPALKPELSDNFSTRLVYYFEPVGNVAIGLFENDTRNTAQTKAFSAADVGYGDDPMYSSYTFYTRSNNGGRRRNRSLTIDYRQALAFLPAPFNNVNVFGTFTRNIVMLNRNDAVTGAALTEAAYKSAWASAATGTPPYMMSGGLSWNWRRLSLGVNAKWTDDTPFMWTVGRYRKHRIMTDANAAFKITKNFSVFLQARNITNEPDYIYDNRDTNRVYRIEHYGATWTFGVKGVF